MRFLAETVYSLYAYNYIDFNYAYVLVTNFASKSTIIDTKNFRFGQHAILKSGGETLRSYWKSQLRGLMRRKLAKL